MRPSRSLRAVPGIEIVELDVPAVGLQSVNLRDAAQLQGASCSSASSRPRAPPASTRWSRSITPTIANSARMSATGRSRSSTFSRSSAKAWASAQDDHYKNLKIKQDVDAIIADAPICMQRHERRSRHGPQGDRQRHARRSAAAAAGQAGGDLACRNHEAELDRLDLLHQGVTDRQPFRFCLFAQLEPARARQPRAVLRLDRRASTPKRATARAERAGIERDDELSGAGGGPSASK